MDLNEFNRSARILGKKYVPRILKELKKHGWMKASDLSSYLDISTATTVNYLKDMSNIGILECREKEAMTGIVKEYRLTDDKIILKTDLD